MDHDHLAESLSAAVRALHPTLGMTATTCAAAQGTDRDDLYRDLVSHDIANSGPIHSVSTYIISDGSDVMYIGEGGPGVGMRHRVYTHLRDKPGQPSKYQDAKAVVFVHVDPPEFRRLAEQVALGLYFQKMKRLPKLNSGWR